MGANSSLSVEDKQEYIKQRNQIVFGINTLTQQFNLLSDKDQQIISLTDTIKHQDHHFEQQEQLRNDQINLHLARFNNIDSTIQSLLNANTLKDEQIYVLTEGHAVLSQSKEDESSLRNENIQLKADELTEAKELNLQFHVDRIKDLEDENKLLHDKVDDLLNQLKEFKQDQKQLHNKFETICQLLDGIIMIKGGKFFKK